MRGPAELLEDVAYLTFLLQHLEPFFCQNLTAPERFFRQNLVAIQGSFMPLLVFARKHPIIILLNNYLFPSGQNVSRKKFRPKVPLSQDNSMGHLTIPSFL